MINKTTNTMRYTIEKQRISITVDEVGAEILTLQAASTPKGIHLAGRPRRGSLPRFFPQY
jgi:hypothetical protein